MPATNPPPTPVTSGKLRIDIDLDDVMETEAKLREELQTCCICLGEYKDSDEIVALDCARNHIFHFNCFRQWEQRNQTCPICRKEHNGDLKEKNTLKEVIEKMTW